MEIISNLVNPLLMSMVFLLAALMMIYKRQWENAFTRVVVSAWFFHLWVLPFINSSFVLDVNTTRVISRWIVLLLGVVEIVSFFSICALRRSKKI